MAKRPSTGKRLRFEVFKRDGFTCQYCGAQPPDVVLVPDHIEPLARGGSNTIENLITACEVCNQGKADLPLTTRQIRPDADLLFLEAQQEILELRRYQAALAEREFVITEIVDSLQEVWCLESGLDWAPSGQAIRAFVGKYGPDIAEDAMRDVARKTGSGYVSARGNAWLRYLYGVARNIAAAEDDDGEDEDEGEDGS